MEQGEVRRGKEGYLREGEGLGEEGRGVKWKRPLKIKGWWW